MKYLCTMLYKRNEVTLKDAITQMVNAYKLKDKITETKLISGWEELMGKTIARHTTDVYLKGNTLVICLNNATVRSEMNYSRDRIKEIVNEFAGENIVKEVVVR